MKDGKLDRDDIGKKFRHSAWLVTPGCEYRWFCLLGFEPERGFAVGYCNTKPAICFRNDNGWLPYEMELKKDPETVLMSTGFAKRFHVNNTEYELTTLLSEVNPCAGQEKQWPLKIVIKNVNYKYRIESTGELSGPVVDEIHGELFFEVRK